jgi:hypothetical protein
MAMVMRYRAAVPTAPASEIQNSRSIVVVTLPSACLFCPPKPSSVESHGYNTMPTMTRRSR